MLCEYLAGFCFANTETLHGGGEKARDTWNVNLANALGAMVTPLCRLLYDGLTPAFQVQGNQQGIGKGELVKAICIPPRTSPASPPNFCSHA